MVGIRFFSYAKKKVALVLVIVISLLLALLVSCNGAGGLGASTQSKEKNSKEKDVINLNLAHFFPGVHPAETEFIQGWLKEIEIATEGKIKITSFPGESLSKAPDVYNNVVEGVVDIGMSCFSYTRGRFPVSEVFELPGIIYNNSKVASKVAWEGIKELNPKEIQDTKLMMVIATGSGDLFTKTPVRKLEDLKGLEVRATGLSAKTIDLLGGIPVAMAQSEAYEALSKGIVKGNLSPIEVLKGWRHGEITKFVTKTPFLYNTLFFVTMNLDKWNSLPEDIQETILEINEKFQEDVGIGLWDKQNEDALKWAVDDMGVEVFNLSQDEMQRWIDIIKPIQDEFTETIRKSQKLERDPLELVRELAEKYNEEY
jgi:TRAP-type C4-dicarboxylate transport system substrate-binding protein